MGDVNVHGSLPAVRRDSPLREVRGLQGGSAGEGEPPDPDPVGGGAAATRPRPPLRGGGGAAAVASPDQAEDDGQAVVELARGVAQVDRAVRRYRAGSIPVHVEPELAAKFGWLLCSCGGGGVRPGAVVTFHGRKWHVTCALREIAMRAAA